ncbi:ABC-type oligopeptide transport system ATPase subunit [Rhizobium sp. BK313]|jgi:ABC-type oligopeptide transport system ATPase subunit|uniref:ATP-binding cassette domain-containing protein n=1 Tax=Rhizobium sp. BK313 TaxID=2587081 RepID=UPI0010ECBB6F|nr:ATP-binding cassette domain-containing protein [Rhizobium sp. BK313]MBB3458035.1 ABC-type oligopeptide transport system ATPase subunit [Rhizobium sp. BK313]
MAELLRVESLKKTFVTGGPLWNRHVVTAVDDVSLFVARGQTLGLVGESGSGKSTLGRCILGLTQVDGGRVVFDGTEVQGLRGKALHDFRRRVQPVFQDPYGSLDPRWTVGRSVRESLDCYRIGTPADREKRVLDLFRRVGLNPVLAGRLPNHLSGGQRQRVAIAAALASEPELIIADEPVSALDMSVQAQILNLLLDLQQDLGVACIFITHDLGVVEHVSDAVAVLYRGAIVEMDATDRIMRNPQHQYTRTLLAAVPRPPSTARPPPPYQGGSLA